MQVDINNNNLNASVENYLFTHIAYYMNNREEYGYIRWNRLEKSVCTVSIFCSSIIWFRDISFGLYIRAEQIHYFYLLSCYVPFISQQGHRVDILLQIAIMTHPEI